MKYYKLKSAITVNHTVPPGLNGEYVRDCDKFFNNNKCGPNQFYDQNYEFDYLVPMEFGEGRENIPPTSIYDYHSWHGKSPSGGWLKPISRKFKELLEQFNLGEYRFYPAWVMFEGKKHEYFVMQIFYDYYQSFLDFDNTKFNNLDSSRRLEMSELIIKKFHSIIELNDYSKEHWDWDYNFERIVMIPEFKKIDFITIYLLGDLVSERLKMAIEETDIKGVEFEELPIPIEFSDEI